MGEKKVTVAEPTFKKLRELKKLGFVLSDMAEVNKAYCNAIQDESRLIEVCTLIFNEPLTSEDFDFIAPSVVWDGLVSFFGKSNLHLIS